MVLGTDSGLLIRLIFYSNFNLSVTHPRLRRQKQEFSSCGQISHHFPLIRGLTTNEPHLFSFPLSLLLCFLSGHQIIPCYLAHFHYYARSCLLTFVPTIISRPPFSWIYVRLHHPQQTVITYRWIIELLTVKIRHGSKALSIDGLDKRDRDYSSCTLRVISSYKWSKYFFSSPLDTWRYRACEEHEQFDAELVRGF